MHMAHFSKIHIGFTFLVPAHLGSRRQRAVKQMCVCHNKEKICCGNKSHHSPMWKTRGDFMIMTRNLFCVQLTPMQLSDQSQLQSSNRQNACRTNIIRSLTKFSGPIYTRIRYDMRCYFNVRSKADKSLIYHTEPTTKKCITEKLKSKNGYAQK